MRVGVIIGHKQIGRSKGEDIVRSSDEWVLQCLYMSRDEWPRLGIDDEDFDPRVGRGLWDTVYHMWDVVDGVKVNQARFLVVVPDVQTMSDERSIEIDQL